DRVLEVLNQNNTDRLIEGFIKGQECFVVGSSWREDLEIISNTIESKQNLKIIIAPHKVDEKSLQAVESLFNKPIIRWSELSKTTNSEADILLIDCVGILTKIYSYATIAYVGGGMGDKGLHNTLEPAVFGIPVLIGKNYLRYQDATDLVSLGGIKSIDTADAFKNVFSDVLKNKDLQEKMGTINLNYIKSQAGATTKVISKLKQVLMSK
ncbi:MAG: 3-deoxy-D-manno-octulosonic-acid transferase, partial [Candidatus Arcticimaribacter sp.]